MSNLGYYFLNIPIFVFPTPFLDLYSSHLVEGVEVCRQQNSHIVFTPHNSPPTLGSSRPSLGRIQGR